MTATMAPKPRVLARGNLRPAPHGQFKLLPVVLPRQPAWNERVARWAASRG